MNTPLDEQVVLITGAAGRIGSAIAHQLHDQGASLILNDISFDLLSEVEASFNQKRLSSCIAIPMDATSEEGISTLLQISTGHFTRIHSAVHCAYPRSQSWGDSIEDLNSSSLFQDLSTQLGGAILFSKLIIRHFLAHGGGNLLHMSSIQGISAPKFEHYAGTAMHSPIEYSAIKSGVISITKWLAKYYSDNKIRVNCISPGGILDNQPQSFLKAYRSSCTNIGMISADHVASMAVFLLSNTSSSVNGQNFVVDDGWSL